MAKSLIKRTKELFSRGRSKGDDAKNDASKENEDSSPSSTAAAPQQIAATESPPTGADGDDVILAPVLIVGAGIVGLVLALALDKYCGLKVELYEQAQAFADDVGAGMGMYPNGLRVIRDISPDLLKQIQEAGFPYLLRRFERHDGTEVATADEKKLLGEDCKEEDAEDLQPIGIRRWRLQKILYQAVLEAGIKIHFNKRLESVEQSVISSATTRDRPEQPAAAEKATATADPMPLHQIRLTFADGTTCTTRLLFACDGSKSQVRNLVSHGKYQLQYTGTTCLMGSSSVPRQVRGLTLPSSETTKCHGAFYPTGENEQCFQFHFPTKTDDKNDDDKEQEPDDATAPSSNTVNPKDVSWGGLTHAVEQEECNKLADRLLADGWDEKFIQPLRKVDKALKIGFTTLEPHLETYVFDHIALVGDSAHPPVPYLGQGAQQGLEDAGTLALLLQHFCTRKRTPQSPLLTGSSGDSSQSSPKPLFSFANVETALSLYNKLRLPRTAEILNRGKLWGKQQQKRAENSRYNQMREENIRRDVFYHETLPILLPAVRHDYREEVVAAIKDLEAKEQQARAAALLVHPASSSSSGGPSNSTGSSGGDKNTEHPHLVPVPEETVCY